MLPFLFPLYVTCVVAALHTNDFPQNLARPFGAARRSIRSGAETLVCETKECRTMAKIFKDAMNETADPCDDFYEYACGGWTKNKPVTTDINDDAWYFLIRAQKELIEKAIDLIKEDVKPEDAAEVNLIKRYYRNCMDQEQTEKDGLEPLIATLSGAGGWPMIMEPDEWSEDIYLWQNVDDYYTRLTGENAFHRITAEHLENKSRLSITYRDLPEGSNRLFFKMMPDQFNTSDESKEQDSNEANSNDVSNQEAENQETFTKKYATSAESRQHYSSLITKVATIMAEARGINIPKQQLAKDIDDMFEFMLKLRSAMKEAMTKGDMSLFELHEWYNTLRPIHGNAKIDWLTKIKLLFSEARVNVSSDIEMKVDPKYYFVNLRKLLNETSRRTIVNYIHWRFVSGVIKVTTKRFRFLHDEIISTSSSSNPTPETEEELSRECMSEIDVTRTISYLFIKKYFPASVAEEANKMISFLKKQVEADILQSEWLDEVSRKRALEKVRTMKEIIEPSWCKNESFLQNYFLGLDVGSSRFDNFLSSRKYKMRVELRSLNDQSPSLEEQIIPLMFDGLYYQSVNTVLLTPADFQSPFFSLSRPSIINYGFVGTVIAHEINHAFHDDEESDITNERKDWFTTVNDAYQRRLKCFVNQFNNYAPNHIGSSLNNGELTKEENIADTMGLETSLAGYYSSRKEERDEPVQTLPGLEKFKAEQLFYLSFALIHCKADMVQKENKSKANPHSSGRLRVIGSVSNSKNFGKSFNCPVGSPMNPRKKCNIWS